MNNPPQRRRLCAARSSDELLPVLVNRATARSTCPKCARRYVYCLPLRTVGSCDPCAQGYEPSSDTYFTSTAPVTHRLAA
ncbi:hypothetical protein [Streptomyces anulatus]|uniref:hypothetical protein n=1 Tax=Streptomyces anulatus TaxID=1892 RepID=UPI001674F232|nr:hypothetical protein [Streptomyces anulatus]